MVGDFVAIEVPRDTPAEYGAAVVASCNAALGDGRCTLNDPLIGEESRWRAEVRWTGTESTELFVELRSGSDGRQPAERRVSFSPDDAPRQRWASAGLVVASLVADSERQPETPPPEVAPPPVPRARPLPAPITLPPRARPWLRLDAGALTTPVLESERFRFGGLARGGIVFAPLPLAVHASARYSRSAGQPELAVTSASAGFTVRIGRWAGPLGLELRAEGVAESVRLTASDPESGQQERATRARFGGALGLDLEWSFSRPVSLVVGGDVTLLRPEVVVDVLGEPRGREPPVSWLAAAALRWRGGH